MARNIDYRRGDIFHVTDGGICVGSEQKESLYEQLLDKMVVTRS